MTQKEKAKAYDELKVKASRIYHKENDVLIMHTIEDLFPELKESEDERIRKELIFYLRYQHSISENFEDIGKWIAWLEKQGEQKVSCTTLVETGNGGINALVTRELPTNGCDEQKLADKVEPKFKVGDWITNDRYIKMVVGIGTKGDIPYYYMFKDGTAKYIDEIDKKYHLWTIQDVKDGDVLCCESGWTCIFKALDNHTNTFSSYCFMDSDKWFCNTGSECHTLDKAFIKAYNGEISPATKEQRDTLMKAMADAGYTFDFEKKELRKIEQKPAWSENDEYIIEKLFCLLDNEQDNYPQLSCDFQEIQEFKDWLKSLKDRVQLKPKQEWSEEDEDILNTIINHFEIDLECTENDDIIKWLKSLRPQNKWKPSEGQLECLGYAIEKAEKDWSPLANNRIYLTLKALKEHLEKL